MLVSDIVYLIMSFTFLLAGVFGGVSFITFPAIRSILTELVPSQNLGIPV